MQGTAHYTNSAVESTCIWVLTSVMSKRVGLGRSGLVLFYCFPQGQSWGDMSDIPMCPCVFSCSLAAWPCGPSLRDHKRQTGLTEPYCKGLFLKRHCCCLWFMRCWPEVTYMTWLCFFKDLSDVIMGKKVITIKKIKSIALGGSDTWTSHLEWKHKTGEGKWVFCLYRQRSFQTITL